VPIAKSHDEKWHVDRVEIIPHRLGRKCGLELAVADEKNLGPANAINCGALEAVEERSVFIVRVHVAAAIGEKMVVVIACRTAFEIVDRHLPDPTNENAEPRA